VSYQFAAFPITYPLASLIRIHLSVVETRSSLGLMSAPENINVLTPDLRVLAECLRLTQTKLRKLVAATLPFAGILGFVVFNATSHTMLALWLGLVGVATAVLLFVAGSEPILDSPRPVTNRRNEITICLGILGLAWGSVAFLAFPSDKHPGERVAIAVAILGALTIISMASSFIRNAFIAGSTGVVVPAIVRFLLTGDRVMIGAALTLTYLFVAFALQFFSNEKQQTLLVRNRIENQLLHARFTKMKERLQASESELNRVYTEFGEQAARDEVTGVFNRRQFTEQLAEFWQKAHNGYDPFSCAFFEIENYERIVSQHGTDAGDELLRNVAAVIDDCLRTDDILARLNGAQFAALLNNTLTAGALIALERIRRKLSSNPITLNGAQTFISVAIGLATFDREAGPRDLLGRVDEALTNARDGGTNRLTVWEQLSAGNTLSLR
jgi:diguanylate cyclase (GGDEF)-like protein